jgi:hypothetical protein
VWATKRFDLIENRVQLRQDLLEMHSERFLNTTTLPAIQELGAALSINSLCANSGRQVGALAGCYLSGETRAWDLGKLNVKSKVRSLVGTSCGGYKSQQFRFLGCDFAANDDNHTPGNERI